MSSPLWRRRQKEDLDEEIKGHLEMAVRERMERGETAEEARAAARRELGNRGVIGEVTREMWGWASFQRLMQDLRYGMRMLMKSPGFTVVAALTLALGIGANTAMFSVVYGVLLRPLPYKDAARLVVLHETTPMVGTVSVSYPNFLDWRAQSQSFSQMAAVSEVNFNLAGASQPENISGEAVSPNFLSMMGVRPFLGRDFDASEEQPGAAPVLLLGYSLWQSHFGGDANAIGRTITLDGRSFTIVGVLPPDFRSPDKTDVMEPIGAWATGRASVTERWDRGDMNVIGRLAPGVSLAKARAEMEGIAGRLAKEYPESNDQFGVVLEPIREAFTDDMRPAILVLFGAVIFVLLIACANVANLFLVRGAARTREIALRMALGASRGRIIRQMLTESFVLAGLGGVLGIGLAIAGIRGIARLIPDDALMGATVSLNGVVLGFAAGVMVLAAFLFGLAPAAHSTNPDVQAELKEGGRTGSAGTARNGLRGMLSMAEISLALILLVGAGLMMKSLYRLLAVSPGFQSDRVVKMTMDLRTQQYSTHPAILNFWKEVLDGVRALPGVENAALGTVIPLTDNHNRADITIEGMAPSKTGKRPHPDFHNVSPGYVSTLGIPLLQGRTFTDADNEGAPRVGMVNAMVARRFFPNGDAIGKRFMFGTPSAKNPPEWITIVGVVGDTKLYGLANPARLEVYVSYLQDPTSSMALLVKSGNDPAALTSAIRGVVASIDKDQPIFGIATMKQIVSDSVATRRVTLILLGLFSALALVLAAIGIYGVISYSVAQRTHEIGIRVAVGAQERDVMRLVVGQGVRLALWGVGIGLLAALGLTRLMSSLLYGVSAADPLTYAGVALGLTGVALAACWIPARRAMRVDPMVALRYE